MYIRTITPFMERIDLFAPKLNDNGFVDMDKNHRIIKKGLILKDANNIADAIKCEIDPADN